MPAQGHDREPQREPATPSAAAAPASAAAAPPATAPETTARPAIRHDTLAHALATAVSDRARIPTLQRKVKIGAGGWIAAADKLPPLPAELAPRYHPKVVKAAKELAGKWAADKTMGAARTFTDAPAFYRAVLAQADATYLQSATPSVEEVWARLAYETKQVGTVREVPWSSLSVNGPLLEAELMACGVQISGNDATTACHGNAHGKLPKAVETPDGVELKYLPKSQQPDHTPYIEFLIPGHKNETEIERGILDVVDGLVYVTAHYDKGSFVLLSGAPANLVANWQGKAAAYIAQLKQV